MRTRAKQRLINIVCCLVVLACMVFVIGDGLMNYLGLSQAAQYAFNLVFFVAVLPAAIALSDVTEWAHPEYFTREELERKGRL